MLGIFSVDDPARFKIKRKFIGHDLKLINIIEHPIALINRIQLWILIIITKTNLHHETYKKIEK